MRLKKIMKKVKIEPQGTVQENNISEQDAITSRLQNEALEEFTQEIKLKDEYVEEHIFKLGNDELLEKLKISRQDINETKGNLLSIMDIFENSLIEIIYELFFLSKNKKLKTNIIKKKSEKNNQRQKSKKREYYYSSRYFSDLTEEEVGDNGNRFIFTENEKHEFIQFLILTKFDSMFDWLEKRFLKVEFSIENEMLKNVKFEKYSVGHLLLYGLLKEVLTASLLTNTRNLKSKLWATVVFDKRYSYDQGEILVFDFLYPTMNNDEGEDDYEREIVESSNINSTYDLILNRLLYDNYRFISKEFNAMKTIESNSSTNTVIKLNPFIFYTKNSMVHRVVFDKAIKEFSNYVYDKIELPDSNSVIEKPKQSVFSDNKKIIDTFNQIYYRNKDYSLSKSESLYHYQNAMFSINMESREEAIKNLDKAISLSPNSDLLRFTKAVYCARIGELEQSIRNFNFAIEISPKNAHYRHCRATIFVKRGIFDESKEDLLRAIDLEPNLGLYRYHLAITEIISKNYTDAYAQLNIAISLNLHKSSRYSELKADLIRFCLKNRIKLILN